MSPPDRWDAYCKIGKVIPGTKFIAFKVPLKESMMGRVPEEDKFSPSILMDHVSKEGLTLAGVIDLTFTWKYYNKEEFQDKSVVHKKVFTKGHEVPSDAVYKRFTEAVECLNHPEHLIGVHCTHGVNRTGYLICRYMIEKLNMEAQDAINLFNDARGHNLERENYLEDLKKRKSGEEMLGLNGNESGDDDDRNWRRNRKPRWRHNRSDHPYLRQNCYDQPSFGEDVSFGFPQQPAFLEQNAYWRTSYNSQQRDSYSENGGHSRFNNHGCNRDTHPYGQRNDSHSYSYMEPRFDRRDYRFDRCDDRFERRDDRFDSRDDQFNRSVDRYQQDNISSRDYQYDSSRYSNSSWDKS